MKYFDKLPTGADRIKSLPARIIGGLKYDAKTIKRKFRRKIICSGSPMNPIDLKMRAKYNRPVVNPSVKFYEVD